MTSTITKQEYSVYYGISELKRLQTAHSLAFDTETLQLQPEEGKLRLIQLGSFSFLLVLHHTLKRQLRQYHMLADLFQ